MAIFSDRLIQFRSAAAPRSADPWLRARAHGPTDLALSFADYIDGENQNARRFEQLSPETIRFIEELERVGDANVSLISTRFHPRSVIDRRAW